MCCLKYKTPVYFCTATRHVFCDFIQPMFVGFFNNEPGPAFTKEHIYWESTAVRGNLVGGEKLMKQKMHMS